MKKIFSLFCFIVVGCSFAHAGTYIHGANQIGNLLDKIEQGTKDAPPAKPMNSDTPPKINTDWGVWQNNGVDGFAFTVDEVWAQYSTDDGLDPGTYHYHGLVSINFADKGYKQVAGTVIALNQPDSDAYSIMYDFGWGGGIDYGWGDQYTKFPDFMDRNDIKWLESIDFSGNDFSNIVIDGCNTMALKTLNLSNNPNLTTLSVINCPQLELLDITGTGLSDAAIAQIKTDVLAASPDCVIKSGPSAIPVVKDAVPIVYLKGNMLYVKNKAPGEVVTVFDLSGQVLIKSADNAIDIGSCSNGAYLVKVNNAVTKVLKK